MLYSLAFLSSDICLPPACIEGETAREFSMRMTAQADGRRRGGRACVAAAAAAAAVQRVTPRPIPSAKGSRRAQHA